MTPTELAFALPVVAGAGMILGALFWHFVCATRYHVPPVASPEARERGCTCDPTLNTGLEPACPGNIAVEVSLDCPIHKEIV